MKKIILCFTLFAMTLVFAQKKIPNINVATLKGKSVLLQDEIFKEKITIISFWATWCVPCVNELDAIADVYEDWQEETGVKIIAIATDDSRTQKRVKPMVNGKDWPYRILLDKNQKLKRALNISVIPHIIVVKNGKIVYRHTGYTPGAEDELYEKIKEMAK